MSDNNCEHEFDYCGSGEWECLKCKEVLTEEEYNIWFTDNQQKQITDLTTTNAELTSEITALKGQNSELVESIADDKKYRIKTVKDLIEKSPDNESIIRSTIRELETELENFIANNESSTTSINSIKADESEDLKTRNDELLNFIVGTKVLPDDVREKILELGLTQFTEEHDARIKAEGIREAVANVQFKVCRGGKSVIDMYLEDLLDFACSIDTKE